MSNSESPGPIRRLVRALFTPSARWPVLVLVALGLVVGACAVIGTQVSMHLAGTDEFCGTTCHSHANFVYPEHKQSFHYANRVGVRAMCVDCHVPHDYPAKVIYKARVGIADAVAELRGTISTQAKFDEERWRLANVVWDEMRANNSANCRTCHDPKAWDPAKQSDDARSSHKKFFLGKATCIDCHTGVAHKDAEEPKDPVKAAAASVPSR